MRIINCVNKYPRVELGKQDGCAVKRGFMYSKGCYHHQLENIMSKRDS